MAGILDIFTGLDTKVYHGKVGDDADAITTEITDCNAIPSVSSERTIIDVPTFGAEYNRKLIGQSTVPNIDLVLNWKPDDIAHKALLDAHNSKTKLSFKVAYSSAGGENYAVFNAYVATFSTDAPIDNVSTATCSLAVDGGITRTSKV